MSWLRRASAPAWEPPGKALGASEGAVHEGLLALVVRREEQIAEIVLPAVKDAPRIAELAEAVDAVVAAGAAHPDAAEAERRQRALDGAGVLTRAPPDEVRASTSSAAASLCVNTYSPNGRSPALTRAIASSSES